jgi:hypothetical protein
VSVEDTSNNASISAYGLEVRAHSDRGSEVEPNELTSSATPLLPNHAYIFGGHQVGTDTDVFSLTVPAGKSLRVDVIEGDTSETCESQGIDSLVELLNSSGTVIEEDDDSGRRTGYCSTIDGTGPSSTVATHPGANNLSGGTYYLRVVRSTFASATSGGALFNYRLVVTIR